MKLIVKNIHFKGTNFASQRDEDAVRAYIAAALNCIDGADTFGRPFDDFDVELLDDDDNGKD